jgi:hypothetical protein
VFRKFGQSHCEYGPQQSVEALSNEYPEVAESAESKLTGTIFPDFIVAICAGASAFAVVPGSEAIATAPESKSVAAEAETAATTRFFFVRIYAYPFDQLSHQRSINSHIINNIQINRKAHAGLTLQVSANRCCISV